VTGVFTGTSLDISGDIDVDGTTNLDVVDIDGAVDMASTALVTGVLTANGGAVFNETGADVDFRVESDTVDHALFVQGSDGNVGIGTSSPSAPLDVTGVIKSASATQSSLYLSNAAKTTGFLVGRSLSSNDAQDFFIYDVTAAATRLAINSSGNVSTSGAVLAGASVNNFAPNKLVTGENTDGEAGLNIQTSTTGTGYVLFGDGAGAAAYRGQIRYSQTDDSMNFHTVTTTRVSIDSSGRVTMPYQPAFSAIPATTQSNIAINTVVTVVFGTERFDVGANFASNTFTAPVTGKYSLHAHLRLENVDSAATYYMLRITTSNEEYQSLFTATSLSADTQYWPIAMNCLADMDASDTAVVTIYQSAGTSQTDIQAESYFNGILVA
jgi:hypothetical protein